MPKDPKEKLIEEVLKEFDKGNFTYRIEYPTKDGKRRWEIKSLNDYLSLEDARRFVSKDAESLGGTVTDFTPNLWIKSLLRQALSKAYDTGWRDMGEAIGAKVKGLKMTMRAANKSHSEAGAGWTIGHNALIEDITNLISSLLEGR